MPTTPDRHSAVASASGSLDALTDDERGRRQVLRTRDLIRSDEERFRFTDLRQTRFEGVRSRFFRLFVPIKESRNRLPTTLPEFADARFTANLSDSPVTAAARLGGTWRDHNVAAITHVAACNLRCPYCYVDFKHLAAKDSFEATANEVVEDFLVQRARLREEGGDLTILRVSGGEPMLTPEVPALVLEAIERHEQQQSVLVKVESNLTALASTLVAMSPEMRRRVERAAPALTVHATIHMKPGERYYSSMLAGLSAALALGMDVYPAIGGVAWSEQDMERLYDDLEGLSPGLPPRLAVRPFQLDYPVLESRGRLGEMREGDRDRPAAIWSRLLSVRAGIAYLQAPRHTVTL
jgi:uncharacterized Fe-S cluster-containing radical SAM superfamily protein